MPSIDGCGASNWYTVYLAVDDDDGTLLVYCAACGQWIEHFGDPAKALFEHLGERHD